MLTETVASRDGFTKVQPPKSMFFLSPTWIKEIENEGLGGLVSIAEML